MLREKSCGIVPFREVDGEIRYLVISSAVTKREHWEFPKGGVEEGERELDTALRELWEETGVKDVRVLPGYREPIRYIYRRPEGLVSKQVIYFIGRVGDPTVTLREVEAKDYRWANYEEARKLLRHSNARALLDRCHAFITGKPLPQPRRQPQRGDAAEAEARRRRGGARRQQQRRPAPLQQPPAGDAREGAAQEGQEAAPTAEGAAREPGARRRRRRRRRRRGGGRQEAASAPAQQGPPAKDPG